MKFLPIFTAVVLATCRMNASDSAIASSAVNGLGIELYGKLAKADANLCISPLSIQTALVMAYAGADGQTRQEMAKVLGYAADDKALNGSFSALAASLDKMCNASAERVKQSKQYGSKSDPIVLTIANRLFGEKGYAFRPPFLDLLSGIYRSPLEEMDFAGNPEKARAHINGWVEDQTKKRIRDLIPKDGVSKTTRLVLANALYLKAPWEKEFNEHGTNSEPFHIHGKEPADAPTMIGKLWARYSKEGGYTALALPYAGGDLQFVILLPEKADGLGGLESKLSSSMFAKCAAMPEQEVIVHLPKFKLESSSIPLGAELRALGMKTAFDSPVGSANFDRMAPRRPDDYLFISEVFHKTFIAVDEHGTEAAAATAVVMAAGAAMRATPPPEVRVDHPFIFAIQHVGSGACLFLGRVSDPR